MNLRLQDYEPRELPDCSIPHLISSRLLRKSPLALLIALSERIVRLLSASHAALRCAYMHALLAEGEQGVQQARGATHELDFRSETAMGNPNAPRL